MREPDFIVDMLESIVKTQREVVVSALTMTVAVKEKFVVVGGFGRMFLIVPHDVVLHVLDVLTTTLPALPMLDGILVICSLRVLFLKLLK